MYAIDRERLRDETLDALGRQGFVIASMDKPAGSIVTDLREVEGRNGNYTSSQQHRFGDRLTVASVDAAASTLTIVPVIEATYKAG